MPSNIGPHVLLRRQSWARIYNLNKLLKRHGQQSLWFTKWKVLINTSSDKPCPLFLKWVSVLVSVHVVKAHMGGSQLSKSKIVMGMCLSHANGPTVFSLAHGWDKIICKYESPHFVIKQLLAGFTIGGGDIVVMKSFVESIFIRLTVLIVTYTRVYRFLDINYTLWTLIF